MAMCAEFHETIDELKGSLKDQDHTMVVAKKSETTGNNKYVKYRQESYSKEYKSDVKTWKEHLD